MSDDLPAGWKWATLSEACDINPPKPRPNVLPANASVTFVPMPAVDGDLGAITNPKTRPFGSIRNGYTAFREGDVIMAKITPCMENGKAAIAHHLENGLGFGSTEFHVLRPREGVLSEFIYYYIRQETFRRAAESRMTGSVGQKRVPVDFLEEAEIPFAPVDEQRRIIARLEELQPRVRSVGERLSRVHAMLKHFRQAILAAACSGCLTEDWREKNPSGENIGEAVEAIRRRRETEAKTAVQKDKIRQIFTNSEQSDSSELPESWRFVALNKLCTSFDYGTSAKSQPSGKVPVLRMGNIQGGRINWADLVYTSDADEIQSYSLRPNTVLFNRTNSPELVGKTAIYRGERPAIFAGYLIRINQLPELDPEYLNICLNTNDAKKFCSRMKTDGVSQSNINARKLGTFEVPFCPLAEQQEIIRRVKALFALADQIEARCTRAKAHADNLTQSILSKAFRGELIPNGVPDTV